MMPGRTPPDLTAPVLALGLAFVGWLGFTAVQLMRDGRTLAAAGERQAPAVLEGDRIRAQLEGMLSGATALADGGNASARGALEALKKQGIAYTPQH